MSASPSVWSIAQDFWDPPADQDREQAQKCAAHLPTMLREAWPILEPANPLVTAWHLDVICEHLMAVSDGELLRLMINVPPRTLKSLLVGVLWPAWEWLRAPHIKWMFASYAADLANRDSLKMRRLIESRGGMQEGTLFQRFGYQGVLRLLHDDPWSLGPTEYKADGGPWSLTADQNAKTKYETTATGMRLATSVGGLGTGEGGERVVVDDPISAKQARSTAERTTANKWWDETMVTRFNNPRAAAVIVAQRLHEDDLCGHLLEQGGWHHLCLPGEYDPGHKYVYPPRVTLPPIRYNAQAADGSVRQVVTAGGRVLPGDSRTELGELLEPVRLGHDKLAELKRSLGSAAYAGQIQQLPAPEEGGMFKRAWFERRWQPGFHRYLEHGWDRIIQSWDMAFKDKASSDFVVGQLWGFHGADCYLLAQVRARLDFAATLHAVRALTAFEPFGPLAVAKLVEDKANGTAVISALRRTVTGLIAIEPQGGKLVRASAVSPRVEAGNVILPAADTIPCPPGYLDEAGEWHELVPTTVADFVHEFAVFGAGSFDDQVDALSQALTWAAPQARQLEAVMPEQSGPEMPMAGVMDLRFAASYI